MEQILILAKDGYGHRMVAIVYAALDRVGNSIFLGGHMDRILQDVNRQVQAGCIPDLLQCDDLPSRPVVAEGEQSHFVACH